jgi:hypothetical protein
VAALLLSAICAVAGPGYAAAQDNVAQGKVADVAYVEYVSGRVVAFSAGKPTLLDPLDVVSDRTRLDLQANSELRICHYQTRQLLTLKDSSAGELTWLQRRALNRISDTRPKSSKSSPSSVPPTLMMSMAVVGSASATT